MAAFRPHPHPVQAMGQALAGFGPTALAGRLEPHGGEAPIGPGYAERAGEITFSRGSFASEEIQDNPTQRA